MMVVCVLVCVCTSITVQQGARWQVISSCDEDLLEVTGAMPSLTVTDFCMKVPDNDTWTNTFGGLFLHLPQREHFH